MTKLKNVQVEGFRGRVMLVERKTLTIEVVRFHGFGTTILRGRSSYLRPTILILLSSLFRKVYKQRYGKLVVMIG